MTEPSESTSLAPTPSAATAWLVALVVPATLLAAFSGVPRYEISQLAIGAIAGGAAALALVMRGVVVQMPSMRSAAGAAILGAALLATVAVLGGLAHGMPATAGDEITRYALLLLGVVLTAAGVGGDRGRAVLGGAVALTAVACGVVSLLQLADVDVLPPIPFSTIPDRAPRSFFDDPAVAAAVLGPLAVTAALLASRAVGAVRVALLVGASLAALAAGLTGDVVLAVCAAIGLGAIAAAADGPARIGAGVAAVLAVAALALAPPADEDPLANPVEPSAPAGLLDYGRGFPWAASDAADWRATPAPGSSPRPCRSVRGRTPSLHRWARSTTTTAPGSRPRVARCRPCTPARPRCSTCSPRGACPAGSPGCCSSALPSLQPHVPTPPSSLWGSRCPCSPPGCSGSAPGARPSRSSPACCSAPRCSMTTSHRRRRACGASRSPACWSARRASDS